MWRLIAVAFLAWIATTVVSGASVTGAVRLGALFAVHGAPSGGSGAACGAVREHYGIQRVEATLQALDRINADPTLLPGLPLGAELRDSCWAPHTALRQTIDLVRDAIMPQSQSSSVVQHQKPLRSSCDGVQDASDPKSAAPLLGVLGPGASSAAAHVQNLLQLFDIPQVSYSATSRELSDRARFATFHRVVPSDQHQARLLVALLRAHNWTYVHALHTDESYGQSGMAAFRAEAARGGVCVAREEPLKAAPTAADVDAALKRLGGARSRADRPPLVQVAVCWCEGRTARAVLAGLARLPHRSRLLLLGSDGWADRQDVVAGLEHVARGSLTLRIRSPYLNDFDPYYHALKPRSNLRNPWFQEFWEHKFNCSLSEQLPRHEKLCTGSESLASNYTQEPKLALVVRGVYVLAHALHDMREALCPAPLPLIPPLCKAMLPFNVSLYKHFLSRVNFRAPDGGRVAFDENGDPPPELSEYDVMRFVGGQEGWRYVRVGRWRGGRLSLRGGAGAAVRYAGGRRAECSAPCRPGQYARGAGGGAARARCCWTCVPCPLLAVTRAPPHQGCRLCPPGSKPDETRTVCVPSRIEWGGGGKAARGARGAALSAGAAGLGAAGVLGAGLWRHRNTPVIKAASRELCALLLASGVLCHAAAVAAALPPAPASCAVLRLAAPALSGVYAALLARTLRIVRLVASAERARKPTFVSSRAQVWMWCALSIPGWAAAAWCAVRWSPQARLVHPGRARSVLACGGERARAQLLPLAPALLLLATAAALAIRARKLPARFNETRLTGAAVYATAVLWLAFFPLYAAAEARAAVLCACASLSALACQALALAPRVFLAVCRPRDNTRERFLTATAELRCHLGGYRADPTSPAPTLRSVLPTARPSKHENHRTVRDTWSQTLEHPRCTGQFVPCTAVGACARVTQHSGARGNDEELTVHIAILHHHHHVG